MPRASPRRRPRQEWTSRRENGQISLCIEAIRRFPPAGGRKHDRRADANSTLPEPPWEAVFRAAVESSGGGARKRAQIMPRQDFRRIRSFISKA